MKWIAILLALALWGCASTQQPLSQSKPAPAAQISYRPPAGSTATLVVIRDAFMFPSTAPREIHLDGTLVASLFMGESVTLLVKPGDHVLGGRAPRNLFDQTIVMAAVNAEAGHTYYFRTGTSQEGVLTFTRAMGP